MDGFPFELPIFLIATFAGALVAGLSGFAFGLVAASTILSPIATPSLPDAQRDGFNDCTYTASCAAP